MSKGKRHGLGPFNEDEFEELVDPDHPRKFMWCRCDSREDQQELAEELREEAEVLDVIWPWHLLVCAKDTPVHLRRRIVKSFITVMKSEDAAFRGAMFGYPPEDVSWYLDNLEDGLSRAFAYLEETKR